MSHTSGLAKVTHLSFSDTSCYYNLIWISAGVECRVLAVITVFQITDAFTIKVDLFLATQKCMIKSQEFYTLYSWTRVGFAAFKLPLFSLLVTVFPSIPRSSGPSEKPLSQERPCVLDCWVTFRGRLPLSPKKHSIQAVGCKRRNFGQEHCGLLCLHGS